MTIVKSKKFKVVMVVFFAIALFAFVNYNLWDYAKANEVFKANKVNKENVSNDGELFQASECTKDSLRTDSAGHNHGDCITFHGMGTGFGLQNPIFINPENYTRLDEDQPLGKGGIKGNDLRDDYEGIVGGLSYRIMDISLEVHDNTLKINYETDTPWIDFDGAKGTLDFDNGFTYTGQDRMDGKDHESYTFNEDQLRQLFGISGCSLEQAIVINYSPSCCVAVHQIYIDDYLGE